MSFSKFFKGLLVVMALAVVAARPASAQSGGGGSDVQREIINNIIQNILQSVRDQLQHRHLVAPPGRLPFSGEDAQYDNRDPFAARGESNPFAALAYTKAPPLAPLASQWLYGANLIGSGDASQTGAGAPFLATHISTATVTGAFDVTKIGIFTATDALTFIGTGSNSWSHSFTDGFGIAPGTAFDSTIPAASGTLSYLNGGFSADFTSLVSWTNNSSAAGLAFVAPANTSSVSLTGNAQYRFDFPYAIFFEPTAGVTYTEVYTSNFGTKLLDSTEVHGGMRVGTEMKWMGFTVQPTLLGAVFQVVDVNTAVLPVGFGAIPAAATPAQGLGGRGSAKITVLWTPNFSTYLEGHTIGMVSTKTLPAAIPNPSAVQTSGVQAGLRYTW